MVFRRKKERGKRCQYLMFHERISINSGSELTHTHTHTYTYTWIDIIYNMFSRDNLFKRSLGRESTIGLVTYIVPFLVPFQ